MMGYGSVEIKLTRLLTRSSPNDSPKDSKREFEDAANLEAVQVVRHYIYIPAETAGKAVAHELHEKGFDVDVRLGADNVNWLVLAKHRIVPTNEALEKLRSLFEAIVEKHEGEYDGWELMSD